MTLAENKDFTLWVLGSHNIFFFLSRAQFTDIQIHSFSVYTRAGFAK